MAKSGPEHGYHRFHSIPQNTINILQLLPPSVYRLDVIALDRGKWRCHQDTQPAAMVGTETRSQEKCFQDTTHHREVHPAGWVC